MPLHSAVAAIAACVVATVDAATIGEPDAYAAELATSINRYRASQRGTALSVDRRLTALAHEHSVAMMRARRLSHDDFPARVRRSGYSMCVENVGWNYATPAKQLEAWRASPGHDSNLVDARVTHAGIAVAGDYVTFIACR